MEVLCVEKYVTVVSHPFLFVIHFTNIHGTMYICNIYFNIVLLYNDWWCVNKLSEAEWPRLVLLTIHGLTEKRRHRSQGLERLWHVEGDFLRVQTWQCATLPGSDNRADICTEGLNAGVMTKTGVSRGRPRQRRKTNVMPINSWSAGFSWTVL